MRGVLQGFLGAVFGIILFAILGAGGDGKVSSSDKSDFVRGLSPWRTYIHDLQDEIIDAKGNYNKLVDKLDAMQSGPLSAIQWTASGQTPTFVDADTFTVPTDMTDKFDQGRRVKAELVAGNFVYSLVASSSFAGSTTTVNLVTANLTSSLSAVQYSFLDAGSDTSLADIFIPNQAQGDIAYYNGTSWTRLAAGTSGQVLTTNGASANPSWGTGVPANAVLAFKLTSCPTGWSLMDGTAATPDMRGRYITGLPSGGTLSSTVGTALTAEENRAVGQHNHSVDPPSTSVSVTDPQHRHGVTVGGGGASADKLDNSTNTTETDNNLIALASTGITASVDISSFSSDNSGTVAGTNAPYAEFIFCLKD